jgi:hypothetical protein
MEPPTSPALHFVAGKALFLHYSRCSRVIFQNLGVIGVHPLSPHLMGTPVKGNPTWTHKHHVFIGRFVAFLNSEISGV